MKNRNSFFILISVITFLFSACNKTSSLSNVDFQSNRKTNEQIMEMVSTLGEQHNFALAKILLRLKGTSQLSVSTNAVRNKTNVMDPNDQQAYDIIINETTQQAMNNFAYLQPSEQYTTDYIKTYVFGYEYGQIQPDYNHRWNEDNIMSSQLKGIVERVQDVVQNSSDRYQTLNQLQTLLDDNLGSISDESERIAFAGAIEIGKSSCNYWYDNVDDWIELYPDFGNNAPTSISRPAGSQVKLDVYARRSSGDIIKEAIFADLVGGLGGMIKGARAGAIFGAQTAAGAMLFMGFVGGVSASAGDGLWSNVKNWIGW